MILTTSFKNKLGHLLFVVVLSIASLNAQTKYTWNGSTSSDWNTSSNWTPSGVPSTTDTVIINNVTPQPSLANNTTIAVLNSNTTTITLNSNTLTVNYNFNIQNTTITAGTVNVNGNLFYTYNSTFNSILTVNCDDIFLSYTIFNQPLSFTKTGSTDNYNNGNNTYNTDLVFNHVGSGYFSLGTGGDTYNQNIIIQRPQNSTTRSYFTLGSGYVASTLASGKTINTSNYYQGNVIIRALKQQGNTAQNITLPNSSDDNSLWLDYYCEFNGAVTATAPHLYIRGSVYNNTATFTRTTSTYGTTSGDDNIFNGVTEFINTGKFGFGIGGSVSSNQYNNNIIINNTQADGAFSISGTLASGKTISIGNLGFTGLLNLGYFIQLGNTSQNLTFTDETTVYLNYQSIFNGPLTLTAPHIAIAGATFNARTVLTHTSLLFGTDAVYPSIFNAPVEFNSTGKGQFSIGATYNDSVIVNSTSADGGINIKGTLANGATITVGSQGFIGTLAFSSFIQQGNTEQNIAISNTIGDARVLLLYTNIFNAPLNITAPHIDFFGSTFNGNTIFTNTSDVIGSSGSVNGNNVFNANATFINTSNFPYPVTSNDYKGNITISNTGNGYTTWGGASAKLIGTTNQNLNFDDKTYVVDFTLNKTSGTVNLLSNLFIFNALTLQNGIINTNNYKVKFGASATVSGANLNSFIDGNAEKTGNTAFTFPVGKNNNYQPLSISAPSNYTDTFTTAYFNQAQTLSNTLESTISNLSTCEYWTLTRKGTSNVNVTLGWNANSCDIAASDTLMRVAYFDTTANSNTWKNLGRSTSSGNSTTGLITSATNANSYVAFALAQRTNPCTLIATAGISSEICYGDSVALLASGGTSYAWLPATGLSSDTIANPIAKPLTTTTYTVTASTSPTCSDTAIVTVTVNPLPIVTATASSNIVCKDSPLTLTGGGAQSYVWTGGITDAIPFYATTINSFVVIGTDTNGCRNTATANITINPLPTVSVTGNMNVCVGGSTILTASGANAYNWLPTAGINNSNTANVVATPLTPITYTISGTDANGCVGTVLANINLFSQPSISASGNFTICNGEATALTATGAITYTWNPATGLNTTSGNSVTANPNATTNYTITGTDANGCTNTYPFAISVNTLPNVQISNPATICVGSSTNLLASGGTTYAWLPSVGLNDNTIANPTANPSSTTTYTVNVSNSNCSANSTVTITVNNAPTANIVVTPSTTIPNGGSPNTIYTGIGAQTLTLTATVGNGATSYAWSPATGLSCTNCLVTQANPSATTTYTLTVNSANNCTLTQPVTINVVNLNNVCVTCE